jgi:hypothetical protein
MTTRIYMCGPYSQRLVLKQRAEELVRESGGAIEITASWLDGEHEAKEGNATLEEMTEWCLVDRADIQKSDTLVQFVEWPSTTGASHCEFMWAHGRGFGLAICGPTEKLNIFHAWAITYHDYYPCIHRETWQEMKAHLLIQAWDKRKQEAA